MSDVADTGYQQPSAWLCAESGSRGLLTSENPWVSRFRKDIYKMVLEPRKQKGGREEGMERRGERRRAKHFEVWL